MAATILIVCSECGKAVQAPADFACKKVRCKDCGNVFVATPTTRQAVSTKSAARTPPQKTAPTPASKAPSPASKIQTKPTTKTATPPPSKIVPPDDDGDGKPYQVSELDLAYRCPDCANEMESADAIICLNCGYNTVTREKAVTRKVHETTGQDYFIWLLPGIACVIAILTLIGFDIWYCLAIDSLVEKEWYFFIAHGAFKMWICIGSLYLIWLAGKFAYKRLILNPTPPEIERH